MKKRGNEMAPYNVRVEVKLKPGHVDSEALTTEKALQDMGYEVEEVSTAKIFEMKVEANSEEEAEDKLNEICKKMLANPVKDDYKIEVEKAG